jgi:hypothetical protein
VWPERQKDFTCSLARQLFAADPQIVALRPSPIDHFRLVAEFDKAVFEQVRIPVLAAPAIPLRGFGGVRIWKGQAVELEDGRHKAGRMEVIHDGKRRHALSCHRYLRQRS